MILNLFKRRNPARDLALIGSMRKFSVDEVKAMLAYVSDRGDCSSNCDCPFCQAFNDGVKCGKRDATIEISRALQKLEAR